MEKSPKDKIHPIEAPKGVWQHRLVTQIHLLFPSIGWCNAIRRHLQNNQLNICKNTSTSVLGCLIIFKLCFLLFMSLY